MFSVLGLISIFLFHPDLVKLRGRGFGLFQYPTIRKAITTQYRACFDCKDCSVYFLPVHFYLSDHKKYGRWEGGWEFLSTRTPLLLLPGYRPVCC